MTIQPDTAWSDDEIVMTDMTPDTDFVFGRMTDETISAVDAKPGEMILDIACGRAIDAMALVKEGAKLTGIEASDTMIEKAIEFMGDAQGRVVLVRSLAENLPFADDSFDKVVCKGAMDHFVDIEKSMAEMARITRPSGRVIIAIANFESLTCRLGRFLWGIRERLFRTRPPDQPFWEPPEDHNFKFDSGVLNDLMSAHCRVEKITGISMLWGFPKWGATLRRLPKGASHSILVFLDQLARILPSLSDVIVASGRPVR